MANWILLYSYPVVPGIFLFPFGSLHSVNVEAAHFRASKRSHVYIISFNLPLHPFKTSTGVVGGPDRGAVEGRQESLSESY